MLKINGKVFMNLQEAVQWLLDNNALPFQSSANYVANTEIGMGTIVNPSPAKVRIGSLIFFADSKVSTVTGLTENGFIVSDQYNDLIDDVTYVSNVSIDASQHLIITLSDGSTIDAGQIKEISNFNIDASQHLIANYNDGTSTDLGAIFQGNVNISGTINATRVTGDEIVENMSGYSATLMASDAKQTLTNVYTSVCKNGNKLTFVCAFKFVKLQDEVTDIFPVRFTIPSAVGAKLYPLTILNNYALSYEAGQAKPTTEYSGVISLDVIFLKYSNTDIRVNMYKSAGNFVINREYYIRFEQTFLLGENLVS